MYLHDADINLDFLQAQADLGLRSVGPKRPAHDLWFEELEEVFRLENDREWQPQ